ncbi:MAG: mechanosensitive ion channel family protein [Candidatus Hodarchaeota archaeon]
MQIEEQWITPLIFLLAGFFFGVLFEILVLAGFRKRIVESEWEGGKILAKSLRGMLLFWFIILGFYGAIQSIQEVDESLKDSLITLILLLLSLSILWVIARVTKGLIIIYAKKTESTVTATTIITNITNFIFLLLGFLIIIQSLGLNITPLLTILGVGTLAVALALQPTLTNFFAGIYLLASREFRTGDYIKLDSGEEGYISDMTWRHTIIRPTAGFEIIIPNARLSAAIVTHFDLRTKEAVITVPVGVGYDSDLGKVEEVTVEIASEVIRKIQGSEPGTKPYVRFHTFSPSSIDLQVIMYIKSKADRVRLRHEFIKELYARYKAENIDIPFPTTVIISKK